MNILRKAAGVLNHLADKLDRPKPRSLGAAAADDQVLSGNATLLEMKEIKEGLRDRFEQLKKEPLTPETVAKLQETVTVLEELVTVAEVNKGVVPRELFDRAKEVVGDAREAVKKDRNAIYKVLGLFCTATVIWSFIMGGVWAALTTICYIVGGYCLSKLLRSASKIFATKKKEKTDIEYVWDALEALLWVAGEFFFFYLGSTFRSFVRPEVYGEVVSEEMVAA